MIDVLHRRCRNSAVPRVQRAWAEVTHSGQRIDVVADDAGLRDVGQRATGKNAVRRKGQAVGGLDDRDTS